MEPESLVKLVKLKSESKFVLRKIPIFKWFWNGLAPQYVSGKVEKEFNVEETELELKLIST